MEGKEEGSGGGGASELKTTHTSARSLVPRIFVLLASSLSRPYPSILPFFHPSFRETFWEKSILNQYSALAKHLTPNMN